MWNAMHPPETDDEDEDIVSGSEDDNAGVETGNSGPGNISSATRAAETEATLDDEETEVEIGNPAVLEVQLRSKPAFA
jgi:hypothetical protein